MRGYVMAFQLTDTTSRENIISDNLIIYHIYPANQPGGQFGLIQCNLFIVQYSITATTSNTHFLTIFCHILHILHMIDNSLDDSNVFMHDGIRVLTLYKQFKMVGVS